MPLSATLTRNDGGAAGEKRSAAFSSSSSSSATILPGLTKAPPFSATEALQAALTSRYASSASRLSQMQQQQSGGGATAALEAASSATEESQAIMSTIGFGIDLGHSGNSSWDATEASVRALRDAMERSTLRLPYLSTLSDSQLQLQVKIGVPAKTGVQPPEPMAVDLAAVSAVLPRSIPIDIPIQVVVGGLAVPGEEGSSPPVCTAIAYVSIRATHEAVSSAQRAMEESQWAAQLATQDAIEEKKLEVKPVAASPNSALPGRVDSMSMLARIAGTVRDNPSIVSSHTNLATAVAVARRAVAAQEQKARRLMMDTEEDTSTETSSGERLRSPAKKARPKTKLRPGLTGKKNVRHFVQHDYTDHAHEVPLPGESTTGPLGGENMPFPFKLYDTLTRIDADGYSDIMSWLPHGRSFKIHDLDGFNDHILPMYFKHSKKSSLLRQLNLYGFRRICAGPDKGSYYHCLFLRGKRFLCGRMRRCKVNGKRIRSAGNPETEPIFSRMDPMPLTNEPILNIHTVSSDVSEEEEEEEEDDPYLEEDEGDAPVGPVSYSVLSFPFKLQALLDLLELKRETNVISWLPHGRAFRVEDSNAFVQGLMQKYFSMSKFSSFQRQLALYSFERITQGADKGAYYHPNFLRGMPRLCREMKRTVVNGKGTRKPSDPSQDPEFYSMPPIPAVEADLLELPLEMPGIDSVS